MRTPVVELHGRFCEQLARVLQFGGFMVMLGVLHFGGFMVLLGWLLEVFLAMVLARLVMTVISLSRLMSFLTGLLI